MLEEVNNLSGATDKLDEWEEQQKIGRVVRCSDFRNDS